MTVNALFGLRLTKPSNPPRIPEVGEVVTMTVYGNPVDVHVVWCELSWNSENRYIVTVQRDPTVDGDYIYFRSHRRGWDEVVEEQSTGKWHKVQGSALNLNTEVKNDRLTESVYDAEGC